MVQNNSPIVDARQSDSRINNNALAFFGGTDEDAIMWNLFSNQRTDVGLETASPNAHDYHSDDECRKRTASATVSNRWRGGTSEDAVSSNTNEHGDPDGSEATKASIGNVCTEQWQHVDPELIEGCQTG